MTEYIATTTTYSVLGRSEVVDANAQTNWQEQALENICPACFDFSKVEGDQSVCLSVDGNMQHSRYRDTHKMTFEVLPAKIFVTPSRRDFSLSKQSCHVSSTLHSAEDKSCGHLFKATKEWRKPEESGVGAMPSARHFDEKGLVGLVCRHGISLRYINIYTGERQSHVTALIQHLFSQRDDIKCLRLCYDVACVFGPALKVETASF